MRIHYNFRWGLCLSLLLLLPLVAAGQGAITGTISDANSGDPLPGVNVVVVSLNVGAATDIDGAYSITGVAAGTYTLAARFVGYKTANQSVTVVDGQTTTADFELNESAVTLDEVVVTGTGGAVEKKKLGNSIGTIDLASLESAPISTFSDVLQGREAGVVGLPSGGITGEGARMRIRGTATLSVSNEPIVYIDGIRVDNGGGFGGADRFPDSGGGGSPSRLDDINPAAIARVEVLKGAAAATLYGTEASNGVIQVFTKQGQVGTPKFDFQIQQGFINYPNNVPDNVGFARNAETAAVMSEVFGYTVQPYELVSENFTHDLFETGYKQTYSGSVSGGSPGISYFVSGRFYNEDGPFGGNDEGRYAADYYLDGTGTKAQDISRLAQVSASLSAVPSNNVRLRFSTYYTDRSLESFQNNNNIYGVASVAMFGKPELVAPNNVTGAAAFATVNETLQQTHGQDVNHFFGSFNAAYTPIETEAGRRVSIDANVGFDVSNVISEAERPFGWDIDNFTSADTQGRKDFADVNNTELTLDVRSIWDDRLVGMESSLVAGVQTNVSRLIMETGRGTVFPGPNLTIVDASQNPEVLERFSEIVNVGVFGQWQLGLTQWLFATVGGRLDANSAFGSDFAAQFYPKIQASIIPSDASFWTGLGPISSLRFRAALGRSGLQPGAFDALTTFESLGGGIAPRNLGNADLKPEVSTEFELGTEFGLFDDRFGIEATYWNRTVTDALVNQQFPVTGGFRNSQLVNIGELKGQGLEASLDAIAVNAQDFSVNVFVNAAYLWEQITDLGGAPPIKAGGTYTRYRNYLVEGYAPGTNFGAALLPVDDGFLPVDFNGDGGPDSRQQVLDYLAANPGSSLPSSTDVVLLRQDGGNPDIPAPLNQFLGKPQPDWSGSFGLQVDYRNFRLNSMLEYRFGNYYINNLTGAFRQAHPSIGRNLPESAAVELAYVNPASTPEQRIEALEAWVYENFALFPVAGLNTLKKGDFLRLRELSLTYTLPRTVVRNLGLRNLSLTASGRNLAILTGYDGIDPEINVFGRSGALGDGAQRDNNFADSIEAFGLALPRQVLFTVNLGF